MSADITDTRFSDAATKILLDKLDYISHNVVLLQFGPRRKTTTQFDWSLIIGQLCTSRSRLCHENGADTSEDADYVAWDGGVSLMAGLSISGLQTLMRCC